MATENTSTRVVQAVFATYRTVHTDLLGKQRVIAKNASRGDSIEVSKAEEDRLDALNALAAPGATAEDVRLGVVVRSEKVIEAMQRALTPTEAVAAVIPEPLSITPPGGGVAPFGEFVTGDTGMPDTPPVTPLSVPGDVTPPPVPYEDQPVDALRAEAERRGLAVEGSGSGGAVVKSDLVAALEADDTSA